VHQKFLILFNGKEALRAVFTGCAPGNLEQNTTISSTSLEHLATSDFIRYMSSRRNRDILETPLIKFLFKISTTVNVVHGHLGARDIHVWPRSAQPQLKLLTYSSHCTPV
jgi:hypothetical protein